jgi:small subunit ribosomal protein S6
LNFLNYSYEPEEAEWMLWIGGEKLKLYETVFVLDPTLDEHTIEKEINKVEELISSHQGKVKKTEKWGLKKFAYPIKKKLQGYYTLIYFEGDGSITTELERSYKLNESLLRYLTVVSAQKEKQPEETAKKEEAKAGDSRS